jgi:DNA helicase II / ATP-dependent DNA helicase PcrA
MKEDILDFEILLQDKYNLSLKPQQKEAVLNIDGPAAFLGTSGSGKTTVILARCVHMMLSCGIAAENILTLTFNRATQKDLETRFMQLFGGDPPVGLHFTTMQSLCTLVLREYCSLTDSKMPRLIEEGKHRLLRSLFSEHNRGEYLPDDRLEELANLISRVKNSMLTDTQIRERRYAVRNFHLIYTAYEEYKTASGCMDYDDMPGRALAIFNEQPGLLERFRNQYRYINVDEAQDITKQQFAVLQELAAPLNNLFMAGDEDQSIYTFLATSSEYLMKFNTVYPDAKMLQLERSYRSTHTIVDAANRLINNNSARHIKAIDTGNEIGLPIDETNLPDNNMLYAHLVMRLKDLPEPGSIAILYRDTVSAVAIMDALDREGIPFTLREQKLPFLKHWVVLDILAFLALGHNPADMQALKQIYHMLNANISRESFDQAAEQMERGSLNDAIGALLTSPNLTENASLRLKKLRDNIINLPGLEPEQTVPFILEKLGYGVYLRKVAGEGLYWESLKQIVESLKAIVARTHSYPELLDRISALAGLVKRAKDHADGDAVMLSTMRAVKGMEFDHVFLVDLFEGRIPTSASISEKNDGNKEPLEEERRLFYMAVTRARKHVEVIYAPKINGERAKPSRFVREFLPLTPIRRAPIDHGNKKNALGSGKSGEKRSAGRRAGLKPATLRSSAAVDFQLEIGMDVDHKSFGRGKISAYDGKRDIVTIDFPEQGAKTFAASFCINSEVIKRPGAEGISSPDENISQE